MSWVFRLYDSTIGKKAIMALTGLVLFGFVIIHMAGNLQIHLGPREKVDAAGVKVLDPYGKPVLEYPIDAYGHMLKANPLVLWGARGFLLFCVGMHIVTMIQLMARNRAARPEPYAMRTWRAAIPPSRLMYFTGPMVFFFIVYHILHFTTGHMHGDKFVDGAVYHNFVTAFNWTGVGLAATATYVIANVFLGMHLAHGAWSMFQSLGIAHPRWTPLLKIGARGMAALITVGNISLPLCTLFGWIGWIK